MWGSSKLTLLGLSTQMFHNSTENYMEMPLLSSGMKSVRAAKYHKEKGGNCFIPKMWDIILPFQSMYFWFLWPKMILWFALYTLKH